MSYYFFLPNKTFPSLFIFLILTWRRGGLKIPFSHHWPFRSLTHSFHVFMLPQQMYLKRDSSCRSPCSYCTSQKTLTGGISCSERLFFLLVQIVHLYKLAPCTAIISCLYSTPGSSAERRELQLKVSYQTIIYLPKSLNTLLRTLKYWRHDWEALIRRSRLTVSCLLHGVSWPTVQPSLYMK